MRQFSTAVFLLLLILAAGEPAAADIYVWTDSSGLKHITNYAPPAHAQVLIRTPEIPYDADADRQRQEADRRAQRAREELALAEREAQLAEREREASERMAAAERLNRETDAQLNEQEVRTQPQHDSYQSDWYWPSSPYPRGYYRANGNIYYRQPRPHHPEKAHLGPLMRSPRYGRQREAVADSADSLHMLSPGRVPQPSGRYPYSGTDLYRLR